MLEFQSAMLFDKVQMCIKTILQKNKLHFVTYCSVGNITMWIGDNRRSVNRTPLRNLQQQLDDSPPTQRKKTINTRRGV